MYYNQKCKKYGRTVEKGDVVSIVLDMEKGQLLYLINEQTLGIAVKDERLTQGEYYFTIIMHSKGESIKLLPPKETHYLLKDIEG